MSGVNWTVRGVDPDRWHSAPCGEMGTIPALGDRWTIAHVIEHPIAE